MSSKPLKQKLPATRPPAASSAAPAWQGLAARVVVGLIFILSGTMKAAAPPEEFSVIIEGYQLMQSQDLILAFAAFLPWAEVIIGFALLAGFMTRASAAAAGGMLLMFIAALLSAQARQIHLPNCGCFGFGWHPTPLQALALDSFLTSAAVAAFRKAPGPLSLDNWLAGGYT